MRDVCEACGLELTHLNTDDGAAFFVIVGYSAIIVPLAVWVEFTFEPALWVHLVLWLPVILGGAIFLMRVLKAWLAAQHYKHNVDDYNQ